MREEDQRLFDDKDKLEESYKKYKSSFYRKNNRMFFDDVKTMSWCKEKYGITEEEVNERKRLKNKGREGKVETFLSALEGGEYDEISFDGKGQFYGGFAFSSSLLLLPFSHMNNMLILLISHF